VALKVPFTSQDDYFTSFKQARRREDDIAIVNAAFFFKLNPEDKTILDFRAAFGGMAPVTKMAVKTMHFLRGKSWNDATIEAATETLLEEFPLPAGVPGGMVRYRQALTASFLLKAYLRISLESNLREVAEEEKSAAKVYHKGPIKSHQVI
jgi:xanthine dehydrogenase/oxidase